jgi:hypothetical protein
MNIAYAEITASATRIYGLLPAKVFNTHYDELDNIKKT